MRVLLHAFDGLRAGVCIFDRDGYYVAVNATAERMFEQPAADLIGRHYLEHDLAAAGREFDRAFRAVAGDGAPRAFEVPRVEPLRYYEVEIADGSLWIVALFRDVTAQKELERARARQADAAVQLGEERYRALVAASSNIVWSADAEGRLLDGSPSWRAFTGQTLEQCRDVGWLDAVHPEDRAGTWRVWRAAAAARNAFHHEVRLRRADGSWAVTTIHGVPILTADGAVREWIGTNTDVTVERRVEAESARLVEAEREARAVAEDANRAKDAFLATVSHELRTPLSAMLGWARMLRAGTLRADRTAHALGVIERNALVQTQIVEDLLDISRIVAGKLRLDVAAVDLAPIVEEAVAAVRPALEAKRIHLEQRLGRDVGPVLGDPPRLRQIVWSLLSNASKFTPAGGRIELSTERAGGDDGEITMTVSDDGPGIPPELMPRLFARFQQADMSTTRVHGGLGLGLAIARHLVELHGGVITGANNDDTPGATFTVRLPIAPVAARAPLLPRSQRAGAPSLPALPELAGLRVLIVDDQPDVRELVATVLTSCGAMITAVSSTPAARESVARARPDVVLCDIAMSHEDGYAFIAWLRALPRDAGGLLPCGALTAYASAEDRRRILDAGYNLHLSKPMEPEEIVQATLNLSRMARAIG